MARWVLAILFGCCCVAATEAAAQVFERSRIGDADGFGFRNAAELRRPTQGVGPGPADLNENGVLEPGEFIPDLNGDGRVWYLGQDEFDNRSPDERANRAVTCDGCLAIASVTQGSAWTDLALSPLSRAGDWPDLNGPNVPNNATFVFDFTVAAGAIVEGSEVFFNLVFADYDIDPAAIFVRFAEREGRTLFIANQRLINVDGLIQDKTASFTFDEVFTRDADGNWRGQVKVTMVAPSEPFTAFDYAELSLFAAVSQLRDPARRYALRR